MLITFDENILALHFYKFLFNLLKLMNVILTVYTYV
jgi:hypothetical protein